MNISKPVDALSNLTDQAAQSADNAIRATQGVANQAFNSLAGTVQDIRQQAGPMLTQAVDQVNHLAHQGADAVREGAHQLRTTAQHASDSTLNYVRNEPVKAMLIAAAVGAAVMWVASHSGRSHHNR